MLEEIKKQFTSIQILITLLIIAVGIYVFQIIWQVLANFSDIIIMLITAWVLSFILEPIVNRLTRWIHMYKIASALVVYMLFFGLIGIIVFLFIPEVTAQLQTLTRILPHYLKPYPTFVNSWGNLINSSLNNSILYIPSVANFLFSAFIVLIISFYFVVDKQRINGVFFNLLPKKWHKDAQFIQEVIDTTFASFLRFQLFFGLLSGILAWVVLRLFNIDFAASTAVITGILTLVPLLGPILGIIPPILVAFISDPTKALYIFLILLLVDQVLYNIVGPRLLGKAFKLHPVIVLLSFFVGFKIAGGAGAVLAVPVLGILLIVLHRLSRHFINPTK